LILTHLLEQGCRKALWDGEDELKILIIDNDRDIVEMLSGWLMTLGYDVRRAYSGTQAMREWERLQPDLVILESALEDIDPLKLCRDMRSKHDTLILVLTASMDAQDEVQCLESGADDYLRKPFFPAQLLAHIHALNRRGRSRLPQQASSIVTVGPIRVNLMHHEVSVRGKAARLTPTEAKLLYLLSLNVNKVCTTNQIVSYVWGFSGDGDANLIKGHIYHLRQKIGPGAGNPVSVQAIPRIGYSLVLRHAEQDSNRSETLSPLKVVAL
jgi:DNA-binding response OmpR family regulator